MADWICCHKSFLQDFDLMQVDDGREKRRDKGEISNFTNKAAHKNTTENQKSADERSHFVLLIVHE